MIQLPKQSLGLPAPSAGHGQLTRDTGTTSKHPGPDPEMTPPKRPRITSFSATACSATAANAATVSNDTEGRNRIDDLPNEVLTRIFLYILQSFLPGGYCCLPENMKKDMTKTILEDEEDSCQRQPNPPSFLGFWSDGTGPALSRLLLVSKRFRSVFSPIYYSILCIPELSETEMKHILDKVILKQASFVKQLRMSGFPIINLAQFQNLSALYLSPDTSQDLNRIVAQLSATKLRAGSVELSLYLPMSEMVLGETILHLLGLPCIKTLLFERAAVFLPLRPSERTSVSNATEIYVEDTMVIPWHVLMGMLHLPKRIRCFSYTLHDYTDQDLLRFYNGRFRRGFAFTNLFRPTADEITKVLARHAESLQSLCIKSGLWDRVQLEGRTGPLCHFHVLKYLSLSMSALLGPPPPTGAGYPQWIDFLPLSTTEIRLYADGD